MKLNDIITAVGNAKDAIYRKDSDVIIQRVENGNGSNDMTIKYTDEKGLWKFTELQHSNKVVEGGLERLEHTKEGWVWFMGYFCQSIPGKEKTASDFLFKEVLNDGDPNFPGIGRSYFKKGNLEYSHIIRGDFSSFAGPEFIHENGQKIYRGHLHGGLAEGLEIEKSK